MADSRHDSFYIITRYCKLSILKMATVRVWTGAMDEFVFCLSCAWQLLNKRIYDDDDDDDNGLTDEFINDAGRRRGVVVSGVRRMNEVNARRARLVLGWVTVFGRVYHLMRKKPTRSTQPCIPPGSLNRVPASAGVKAGMSPLSGGR